ncbi:MAG: STAS domain-containing protein [Candidatus Omnitrophota bacterium]
MGKPLTDDNSKKLHVCLDDKSGAVFYASMIFRKGFHAELRTSWKIEKGMTLLMMPVPEGWDGKEFKADEIRKTPGTFEAHINRTEGKGLFHVRILSEDQKDIVNKLRSGSYFEDSAKIETSEAGAIVTIKMTGKYNIESAIRLESVIRDLPGTRTRILLDMSQTTYPIKTGVGMLLNVLKMANDIGFKTNILVKPETGLEKALLESEFDDGAKIFTDRDIAVSALLLADAE